MADDHGEFVDPAEALIRAHDSSPRLRKLLKGQQSRIHVYEPGTSALLLQTIEANVDNDKLSDAEFRQFIRNSLPTAQKDES